MAAHCFPIVKKKVGDQLSRTPQKYHCFLLSKIFDFNRTEKQSLSFIIANYER